MHIFRAIAGFDGTPALVAVAISGNSVTVILAVVLAYTFFKTVWMEQSVENQRVYDNVIPFFSSLMWALYSSDSLPYKPFFFISNAVGFVLQIICTFIYIYFAKGKKLTRALLLFFTFLVFALIITTLVAWMVVRHRWNSTFIDVIAAVSGESMHIVTLFDLVMKRKDIKNTSLITLIISLVGACIWTTYGFMSVPLNYYVVVPNLVTIVSVAVQLIMYALHCMTKSETKETAQTEAKDENKETYNTSISSPDSGSDPEMPISSPDSRSDTEMLIAIPDRHDDVPNSTCEINDVIDSPV